MGHSLTHLGMHESKTVAKGTNFWNRVLVTMKDMQTITHWQKHLALPTHMPRLLPKFRIPISLPLSVAADSLLGETIEIAEAAGDAAEVAALIAAA